MTTPGTKISDEIKQAALERLKAGETPTVVAKALGGIHRTTVSGWRKQITNVKAAPKKKNKRAPIKPARIADAIKIKALERLASGKESAVEIAADIGVSAAGLYYWRNHSKVGRAPATPKANGHAKPNGEAAPHSRAVHSAIGLLRGVKGKIDISDPVHLTAMLVLQTLEGKL